MNSNTPPTPRGNRSTRSDSPQETPNVGFQQFQQNPYYPQFVPNVGFQQFQQSPIHPFSREGLILQGYASANFPLPPPAFNTGIDLEEIVPETPQTISTQQSSPDRQPSPTPNPSPTQNQKKKKYEKRAARQPWTKAEEMALASAWIDVSEDPLVGNAQNRESFWGRIEKVFYKLMCREKYRTHHQLSTKYKDLNKKVQQFAGIYNNLYNSRSSGSSEADILKAAHVRYENEYQAAFIHEQAWDILKSSPKWNTVPTMTNTSRGSKRTQTSDEDAENVRENEQLQRPIGRNTAKKAATSSTDDNRLYTEISDLRSKIDDTVDYKMKKLEVEQQKWQVEQQKCEIELEKLYEKDFEFFIAPHDHLTGAALQATLARKERIRQKHNWSFEF